MPPIGQTVHQRQQERLSHHALGHRVNGPVARPNVDGSEKIPAPTIEPMTSANNDASDSFWVDSCATDPPKPPNLSRTEVTIVATTGKYSRERRKVNSSTHACQQTLALRLTQRNRHEMR